MTYRAELETPAFLMAAIRYETSGRAIFDPHLTFEAAVTGMGSDGAAAGGFLAPTQMAENVWQRVTDIGQIISRTTKQPIKIKADGLALPSVDESSRANGSRFGGAALAWIRQGDAFPQMRPQFGRIKLVAHKLGGIITLTDELLRDAVALAAFVERAAASEIAFDVEDAVVNGTGIGMPLGILNSGAVITVAAAGGQSAGTIVPANLKAMAERLWAGSFARAVWLTSVEGLAQVGDASFSNGAPVVTYGPDGKRLILGFEVLVGEYTPALGLRGDIVLADLGEFIVSERDPGTSILSSIHLRYVEDQTSLRIAARVDGSPGWSSAVTPKNGSVVQAPFITLAPRP